MCVALEFRILQRLLPHDFGSMFLSKASLCATGLLLSPSLSSFHLGYCWRLANQEMLCRHRFRIKSRGALPGGDSPSVQYTGGVKGWKMIRSYRRFSRLSSPMRLSDRYRSTSHTAAERFSIRMANRFAHRGARRVDTDRDAHSNSIQQFVARIRERTTRLCWACSGCLALLRSARRLKLLAREGPGQLDPVRTSVLKHELARDHVAIEIRVVDALDQVRARLPSTNVPLDRRHEFQLDTHQLQPMLASGTVKRVGRDFLWTRL